MKLLAILLLSIAGMYLGYKLRKSSKEANNERFAIYGGLTFLIALTGAILGTSLVLLKGGAWSIENKMMFRLIFSAVIGFMFLFLGVRLIAKAKNEGNKLGQIAGLTWVLVACFVSGLMITRVSKMNDGWTTERKGKVMADCEKLINENRAYNVLCFKREVIKAFPNFEDYNKMNADESTGKREKFLEKMDELCPCGENIDESEVESVDLPF
ncbi:hypothetical protein OAF64_00285 [Crocinitomicaceae bacterium]|nr:hypothetical protein [Crocinitomicaceae bacterium]